MFGTVATTPFIAATDRDTLQAISQHTAGDDLAEPDDTGDNGPDTETEDPR
ncbi:hypothetical protein [Rhodococcus sp. NBC_00294]|uniref:hypothetical protein n=1 Tax=Rhodococcus sp. NBC_00294 TaxID=2976004 RepID=UPI002E293179|nr:hypothetical protein [Rhodococcus sp. NBC_00294]